jgi:hypothetical protein
MGSIQADGAVEKDAPALIAWLDMQAQVDRHKKIGTQGAGGRPSIGFPAGLAVDPHIYDVVAARADHPTRSNVALRAAATGALALGACAIGALAVGRLAIGVLSVKRVWLRKLAVKDIEIERLAVCQLVVEHSDDVVVSAYSG